LGTKDKVLALLALIRHRPLMKTEMDKVIEIAIEQFGKLFPEGKATGVEIEEIEEDPESGNYLVTIGYWARDNKPESVDMKTKLQSMTAGFGRDPEDILNPWRRKYRRVEIDSKQQKAVAIRMYEPPLGVS